MRQFVSVDSVHSTNGRSKRAWLFGQWVPGGNTPEGAVNSPQGGSGGGCCTCHQGPAGPVGPDGDDGEDGKDGEPGADGQKGKVGYEKNMCESVRSSLNLDKCGLSTNFVAVPYIHKYPGKISSYCVKERPFKHILSKCSGVSNIHSSCGFKKSLFWLMIKKHYRMAK